MQQANQSIILLMFIYGLFSDDSAVENIAQSTSIDYSIHHAPSQPWLSAI